MGTYGPRYHLPRILRSSSTIPPYSQSHPHTPHSPVSCRMSAGRTGQRRMLFYDCMMSMMPPSSMDHNATLNATCLHPRHSLPTPGHTLTHLTPACLVGCLRDDPGSFIDADRFSIKVLFRALLSFVRHCASMQQACNSC